MSIYYKNNLVAGNSKEGNAVTFDDIYPVGSIYLCVEKDLPTYFVDHGVWEPVASGKCLWGSDTSGSDVGTYKDAGLPQHTHDGVLVETTGTTKMTETGGTVEYIVSKTGNASNSIYGSSDTVQPPAFVVRMWRRIS